MGARHEEGFSEAAMRQLQDESSRFAPIDSYEPAAGPPPAAGGRRSDWRPDVPDPGRQGDPRPHYHGHRERLRRRFHESGAEALPDYELLELLLFNAIDRRDVKPFAKRLLARFGDLGAVLSAPELRLREFPETTPRVIHQFRLAAAIGLRITRARAVARDVISSWEALMAYCKAAMAHRETEEFRILFLDRKNVLIADEAQGRGTVDHVPVYPREVAKRSLELNASAIILVHNHPSGDPSPSPQDIEMTKRIDAACKAVGVAIHDHVVIGKETDASFRELGLFG